MSAVYVSARTVVRTVHVDSYNVEVNVGMHQGSALSPLLFVIVIEAISREMPYRAWELLYADDLVMVAESKNELGLFSDRRTLMRGR